MSPWPLLRFSGIPLLRYSAAGLHAAPHGKPLANESNIELTHIHLNDNTVAGIALKGRPVFSVQYHPEASAGPHDSRYLFDQFVANMEQAAVPA